MNPPENSPEQEIAPESTPLDQSSGPGLSGGKGQKGWIKHIIAAFLGLGLLWFAFRGCNFAEIWNYSKNVHPLYLVLIFISGIASHFLRALRWIFLLKPLAPENKKLSIWNSFCAVVYGYAVNVVLPRGGEIVRLVSMSKMENLPWAGVLPTLFIDRLLDVLCLAFLTGLTLTYLPDSIKQAMPGLVPGGISMLVCALIGLIFLPKLAPIMRWGLNLGFVQKLLPPAIKNKIAELMDQFEKGSSCISNPLLYPVITLVTVIMWLFYWVNYYLMVYGFDLQNQVKLVDTVTVFTIGSAGNLIPTPGSVGGFHVLVKESMILTSKVNPDQAMAFATVLHLMCYIVTTFIPAGFCYLINVMNSKKTASAI